MEARGRKGMQEMEGNHEDIQGSNGNFSSRTKTGMKRGRVRNPEMDGEIKEEIKLRRFKNRPHSAEA